MMEKNLEEDDEHTVFHSMLNSGLPDSEKSPARLAEEAVLLVGAGTHTTSWALSVACFHLLSQPELLRKLDRARSRNPGPIRIDTAACT
jgi:cytochrome P450